MITLENAIIEYYSKKFVVDEEEGCCYYRGRNGDIFVVPLEVETGLPLDEKKHTMNIDDYGIEFSKGDILDLKYMVNMVLDDNKD